MQKKNKTIWIASAAATAVLAVGGAATATAVGGLGGDDDQPLAGSTLERVTEAALAEVGSGTVTDAEASDDAGSAYEAEVVLDNGDEVDVELDEAFEVVRVGEPETDDDDDDGDEVAGPPLSEADRAEAEDAALAEVGAGTVTDVERSDDTGSGYEVEVALDSGDEVEVALDADFQVVGVETEQDD